MLSDYGHRGGLEETNKVGKFTIYQELDKNTPPPPTTTKHDLCTVLVNDTFYRFSFFVLFHLTPTILFLWICLQFIIIKPFE